MIQSTAIAIVIAIILAIVIVISISKYQSNISTVVTCIGTLTASFSVFAAAAAKDLALNTTTFLDNRQNIFVNVIYIFIYL